MSSNFPNIADKTLRRLFDYLLSTLVRPDGSYYTDTANPWRDRIGRPATAEDAKYHVIELQANPPDGADAFCRVQPMGSQVSSAHGRVDTLKLASLLAPAFEVTSFVKTGPGGADLLLRWGDTITDLTVSAAYSESIDYALISTDFSGPATQPGDLDPGDWSVVTPYTSFLQNGSAKRTGVSGDIDPVMTITLEAFQGFSSVTEFLSIYWTRDVYFGPAVAGIAGDGAALASALSSQLQIDRFFSVTPTLASQKMYICIPEDYGEPSYIRANNLEADFLDPVITSITNVNGVASDYRVYESRYLLTSSSLLFEVL